VASSTDPDRGRSDQLVFLRDMASGRMLYLSAAFEEMFEQPFAAGYENPMGFVDLVHPDDRERVAALLAASDDYDTEVRMTTSRGERWLRLQGVALLGADGVADQRAGIVEDVTEQHRQARERERLQAAQRGLVALAQGALAQSLRAEEGERQRLSLMLHDHALQQLLAARQDLAEADDADGHGAVGRARIAVEQAVAEIRDVVSDLHPALVTRTGLAAALTHLGELYGRHGRAQLEVAVAERCEGMHDELLLSIARELIRNAQKHADAEHVVCRVVEADGGVLLTVVDDGCGFDLAQLDSAVARGHIGLAGSRARVEALGGRFELASDDTGTTISVWLPAAIG
jgi:signal transduction histidine kinase